jgi:hypothetical protein
MINNIKNIAKVALITTMSVTAVYADCTLSTTPGSRKFAIGPVLNTAGIGIEARMPITQDWFARAAVRGFKWSDGFDVDGALNLKPTLTLLTVPVMIDYHPIESSGFRVSGGIAYNGNKLSAKAKPTQSVTLFGNTYTPAQIGSVTTTIKFGNAVAPIMSIGYDNSLFDDSSRVSFNAEVGIMYAGKPKLKVSSTGIVGNALKATGLQDDLTREAKQNLKKVEKYLKWYPVIGLGFRISL